MNYFKFKSKKSNGVYGEPEPTPPVTTPPDVSDVEKKLKETFDRQAAQQRRANDAEIKKMSDTQAKLATDLRLSQEEREAAAKEVERLDSLYKTTEQLKKEQEEKHKNLLKEKEAEVGIYKTKYENVLVDVALSSAAAEAEELVPGQLQKFVRNDAILVPEMGKDSKPTGNMIVKLKYQDKDTDGNTVDMLLPVKDAFEKMKSKPDRFGNFFKSKVAGGVGGSNFGVPTGTNGLPIDTDSYMAQRAANKKAGKL